MHDFMFSQNNVVTTVYDIFHLYTAYHSSIYVDLIAPVANVFCYFTISTLNKYFLSYLILLLKTLFDQKIVRSLLTKTIIA